MSQSNVLAFFLIVGFIVFITLRGELTSYLGVLGLGNVVVSNPSPSTVPNVVTNTYSQNPPANSSGSGGGLIGGLISGIGGLFGF